MAQHTEKSKKLMLEDFSFPVPENLAAQFPPERRSSSRMLCQTDPSGTLSDHYVTDLPSLLPPGSLVILNNSKVFPGRLPAWLPEGGRAEIFLLEKPRGTGKNTAVAKALGRPLKKLRQGTTLRFAEGLSGHVSAVIRDGEQCFVRIEFAQPEEELSSWINRYGLVPLPPYIRRDNPLPSAESPDRERYQTVYAGPEGSVAAPTAGLHFDQELLDQLQARGVRTAYVTLHVGAGTFLPVRHQDPTQHRMHEESFWVPKETTEMIQKTREAGKPVIGVGTTSFRAVESLCQKAHARNVSPISLSDQWHQTDLFIRPEYPDDRYRPHSFDGILTNFHQPESTLFMLICALLGYNRTREIYQHAIAEKYRLFSYGDSGLYFFD